MSNQNIIEQTKAEPDIQERIDGFNKDVLPLLGKYELALAAMPQITQDGRLGATPILISARGLKEEQQKPAPDAGLSKVE